MEQVIIALVIIVGLFIIKRFTNTNKSTSGKINNNTSYRDLKSDYVKDSIFEDRNYNSIYWEDSPYMKKDYLLNKNELTFYKILQLYLEDTEYVSFPKVRLADVIFVNTKYNFSLYFKKIGTKSIDFLLCHKDYLSPKIALYLDDYNHLDEDMLEDRDYITKSLEKSGIKVFRINSNLVYDLDHIDEILNIKYRSS